MSYEKAYKVWNNRDFNRDSNKDKHPFDTVCVIVYVNASNYKEAITKAKQKAWSWVYYNEDTTDELTWIDLGCVRSREDDRELNRVGGWTYRYEREHTAKTDIWRKTMQDFVDNNPDELVYIYSGEHHLYWRSERKGYASNIRDAGVYTAKDAWDATSHCGLSKRIMFKTVNSRKRIGAL